MPVLADCAQKPDAVKPDRAAHEARESTQMLATCEAVQCATLDKPRTLVAAGTLRRIREDRMHKQRLNTKGGQKMNK